MKRTTRVWLAAVLIVCLLGVFGIGLSIYRVLQSGVTRPMDNLFGDQHLKTVVALVELHKIRYGRYPKSLRDLRFTGEWDALAISSKSYCASEDGLAYYVEVQEGWVGKPDLHQAPEFWQGTGFKPDLGPCH